MCTYTNYRRHTHTPSLLPLTLITCVRVRACMCVRVCVNLLNETSKRFDNCLTNSLRNTIGHTHKAQVHTRHRHTHTHKEGDRQAIKEDVREKGMVEQGEQGRTEHKVHVKSMLLLTSITFSFTSPCPPVFAVSFCYLTKFFALRSPPYPCYGTACFRLFHFVNPDCYLRYEIIANIITDIGYRIIGYINYCSWRL